LIARVSGDDVEARRHATAQAHYVFCGHVGRETGERLLKALGERLKVIVNGHEAPVEPDEYVRERCVEAMRLAVYAGFDVGEYVPLIVRAHERDSHEWVRERAEDALSVYQERFGIRPEHRNYPKAHAEKHATTTRPLEKQLRA
jgi:hypothetical protein